MKFALMIVLANILLLGVSPNASASKLCEWQIIVRNYARNDEDRVYRLKTRELKIELPGSKGFPYCHVQTPLYYELKAISPKPNRASQVNIFCFTDSGDAIKLTAMADELTVDRGQTFTLFKGPFHFIKGNGWPPRRKRDASASGMTKFIVMCTSPKPNAQMDSFTFTARNGRESEQVQATKELLQHHMARVTLKSVNDSFTFVVHDGLDFDFMATGWPDRVRSYWERAKRLAGKAAAYCASKSSSNSAGKERVSESDVTQGDAEGGETGGTGGQGGSQGDTAGGTAGSGGGQAGFHIINIYFIGDKTEMSMPCTN